MLAVAKENYRTKMKLATKPNNSDPCTLLIETVLIKMEDVNEDNIKQELTWLWPIFLIFMSTVAPAHY